MSYQATNAARYGPDPGKKKPVAITAQPGCTVKSMRSVLITLADAADDDAITRKGVASTAEQTELAQATVKRAQAGLVAQGLIVMVGKPSKGKNATLYRINLPGLPGHSGPVPTHSSDEPVGVSATHSPDEPVAKNAKQAQPTQTASQPARQMSRRSLDPNSSSKEEEEEGVTGTAGHSAGAPAPPTGDLLGVDAARAVIARVVAPVAEKWKLSFNDVQLVPAVQAFMASGRTEAVLAALLAGLGKPRNFTFYVKACIEKEAAKPLSATELAVIDAEQAKAEKAKRAKEARRRTQAAEKVRAEEQRAFFAAERVKDAALVLAAREKRDREAAEAKRQADQDAADIYAQTYVTREG